MASLRACVFSGLLALGGAARGQLTSYSTICGDAAIWSMLTADPTLHGIVNINFQEIEAKTTFKVGEYDAKIALLKKELEELLPKIAEALEQEKVPETSQEQIDELISAALTGSFGSLETAKSTQCGNRRAMSKEQRKSMPRTVFEDTKTAFGGIVEKFMAEQAVVFNGELWSSRFWSEVGKEGYCDQLCQELRDMAASKAPARHPTVSTTLQTRKQEIEAELRMLEEKKKQCEAARGVLEAFSSNMKVRKVNINERHEDWRKAQSALDDVQDDLDDVQEELEQAEEKLEEVTKKLDENNAAVKDAKDTLEELVAEEKEWKDKVGKTATAVAEVGGKLKAAGEADDVIEKLRNAVSVTALKMRLLFETAALSPVESAGLSADTALGEYFFERLELVPGETELSASVDDLTTFCTAEAMPVFKEVKEVDLTPLCEVGEAASIKASIHASMTLRIGQAQKLIKQVQTWFDPLKGIDVTKTPLPTRLAAGEPEGLLQTMSVYSDADFFQYLKGWEYRGEYLELIKRLRDAAAELENSMEQLKKDLADFKESAGKVKAKREAAEQKLKEAEAAAALSEKDKEQLEAAIEALKEQSAKLEAQAGEMEAQLDAALAALIKAKEAAKALFTAETGAEAAPGLEMR